MSERAPTRAADGPAEREAPEARAAFNARGIDAPRTELQRRGTEAPLDRAVLAEAMGDAEEVSPEVIEARDQRAGNPVPGGVVGGVVGGVMPSEPASTAEIAEEQARHQQREARAEASRQAEAEAEKKVEADRRPPPPAPPVEKPADVALDQPKAAKKDAKDDRAPDGTKSFAASTPKTVLPAVTRAPSTGKILVTGASGHKEALVPRAVRVVAWIEGPRARTVVDLVFENPHEQRLEGTFHYPLPADASPAGFAMFDGTKRVDGESLFQSSLLLPELGGTLLDPRSLADAAPARGKRAIDWGSRKEARVVEQARAREVYEDIVRKSADPALLEWSGGSSFEARVFPLEPKSLKRVVIAYEQSLVFDGRSFRYEYSFPTEPSIRERAGLAFVDGAHGIVSERSVGAREQKLGRWTRLEADVPKRPGEPAAIAVAVTPTKPSPVLRGRDPAGLPGDSFYTEVRPNLPRGDESATGRALILVDTSLSSEEDGSHARRARLIEALLARDTSIRQYAVGLFDLRVRWLHGRGWRDNSADNRRETASELRRVYLEGATSFAAVLEELERQRAWAVDGAPTTVFLLSDGEITWGLDKLEALAARHPVLRDVRWITYRLGEAPGNQALFDLLSNETRGRTVTMLSEAEVDQAAVAHRAEAWALEGVKVVGAPAVDVVVAGDPRLVFPGQTLKIAGRLPEGGTASLAVTLRAGARRETIEVPLGDRSADDGFAPRAWAELHTKKLIALDDVRLDRMVVALSQHYRLANARASFLVLESEQQVKDYALADEKVDLAALELLRRREEDQRRDRLLGVALDEVPREGRALVELLAKKGDGLPPLVPPQPLLDAPFAGGEERIAAEVEYRRARDAEKRDFLVYDRVARARALSGDTAGAVRALSSAVEMSPRDGEAMRLVGYALLALAQWDVAAELFERLRLLRPFEPETFLEEAFALEGTGRWDLAARNYEIVLARSWARHQNEARVVGAHHYARMLFAVLETGKLQGDETAAIERRLAQLRELGGTENIGRPIDLQLTTFWSTDSVDIDLWMYEPSGEKCFYGNRETKAGGHLFWDVTDGLGPELYQAVHAEPGQYDAMVHFFGSGAPRLAAPTAMLLVVDRGLFTPGGGASRRFQMRLLPKKDTVSMLRSDTFGAR